MEKYKLDDIFPSKIGNWLHSKVILVSQQEFDQLPRYKRIYGRLQSRLGTWFHKVARFNNKTKEVLPKLNKSDLFAILALLISVLGIIYN